MSRLFNIASLLTEAARRWPDRPAVVAPHRPDALGRGQISYRELDESSSRLAAWLLAAKTGSRLAVLLRPGADFATVVYGLFKAGLVPVMVDPGMGRAAALRCLAETRPAGLAGPPLAHLFCLTAPGLYKKMKLRLTLGPRLGWGGATLAGILGTSETSAPGAPAPPGLPAPARAEDPAAILFTSGATGPAKGVVYTHAMFAAQVEAIREGLDIRAGGRDLATFPLFALFAPALGLTAVIPNFNASRPARANPRALAEPLLAHQATSLFASPTLLNKLSAYAKKRGLTFPSLERVIAAGAPVHPPAVAAFHSLLKPGALLQTPYGATEGMPLTRVEAREILSRPLTERGVCVGRPLSGVRLAVIKITDEVLTAFEPGLLAPAGEIGEIIAQGPMVAREYFERPGETLKSIIPEKDSKNFWRRMGDAGRLDEEGRLWFCGRLAHRATTARGELFSLPCEALFNRHPLVRRSALAGVGPRGAQKPVVVVETEGRLSRSAWRALTAELRERAGSLDIHAWLRRSSLPVDPRHNAKINREALAAWAARVLKIQ